MNQLGLFREDPKLAFGRIPVALTVEIRELKARIYGIEEILGVEVREEMTPRVEPRFLRLKYPRWVLVSWLGEERSGFGRGRYL